MLARTFATVDLRDDPITGLVAWPEFEARLPTLLAGRLRAGRTVGMAIGDCNELKAYVEAERVQDPRAWGHQAGNRVMAQLGGPARWWLAELDDTSPSGVLATFGGDEVIVVLARPPARGSRARSPRRPRAARRRRR